MVRFQRPNSSLAETRTIRKKRLLLAITTQFEEGVDWIEETSDQLAL